MIRINLQSRIKRLNFLKEVHYNNGDFDVAVNNFFSNKSYHVYNSTTIEGSPISYKDASAILDKSKDLSSKYSQVDIEEVKGLSKAVDKLKYFIDNKFDIIENRILDFHKDIYVYDSFNKGYYRNYSITTALHPDKEIYTNPKYIQEEMDELIERYHKQDNYSDIEKTVNLKLDFIMTHPFRDGNGRTSRLLLNWTLIQKRFIPIDILASDVSNYIDIMDKCRKERTNVYLLDYVLKHLEREYANIKK